MILALLSLCCLAGATLVFAAFGRGRAARLAVACGAGAVALMLLVWFGLNAITGEGINDAVFYHLHTGLEGGDVSQYGWLIAGSVAALAALLAGCWLLYQRLPQGQRPRRLGDALAVALVGAALLANPFSVDLSRHFAREYLTVQQTEGFADAVILKRPEKRKNLVFLYLESVERSYFDEAVFPGLITDLRAIEAKGRSFTGLGQSIGAGFTIGGMVAGQCGVPLILSGSENSMQVSQFLPGATCLGDLLKEEGYHTEYLGGSSRAFAGKGSFYESHSFDRVSGLEDLKAGLEDPAYLGPWGLQDDTLYALAHQKIAELSAAPDPFALVMLTLDTHHPDGHANSNRACKDLRYGDGSNAMLTSVRCADKLAGAFLRELLDSPLAEDTVIVVASDHLAMVNGAAEALASTDRSNMFIVLEPGALPARIDRKGTTLDIGATVMAALGYEVPELGFGVNLMGKAPTLAERMPEEHGPSEMFADYLMGFQAVYARLWDYPKVGEGFYANVEGAQLQFGPAAFKVPALMQVAADGAISGVTLDDPVSDRSLARLALDTPGEVPLLWVDACAKLAPLTGADPAPEGLCLASGALGSARMRLLPLPKSRFIARADVLVEAEDAPDAALIERRQAALRATLVAEGNLPLDVALPAPGYAGRAVELRSSAAGRGLSLARAGDGAQDLPLERGLTLVGVTADGALDRLAHVDSCAPGAAPVPAFRAAMKDHALYAIVSHDSAVCDAGRGALEAAVAGLDLPQIARLGFRQPYVAVLAPEGGVKERLGEPGGRVLVRTGPEVADAPVPKALPTAVAEKPAPVPQKPAVVAAAAPVARKPAAVAAEPVAAPKGAACVLPPEAPAGAAPVALPLDGAVALGSDAPQDAVVLPRGWWQAERQGRWIGATRAEMTVILPGQGGRLEISGVPYRRAEMPVEVWAGPRRLATAALAEARPLTVDMAGIPAGEPVTLTLVFPDAARRCPQSEGTADDRRSLVAMIRSLRLVGQVLTEPSTEAEPAACIVPPEAGRSLPADTLAPGSATPVGPEGSRRFGFGSGWWRAEPGGRWIGAASAELSIILPEGDGPLNLELSGSAFAGPTVRMELRFRDRVLYAGPFGAGLPVVVPLGDLPRGRPVALHLGFPGAPVTCPKAAGNSGDDRTLVALIETVTLRPAGETAQDAGLLPSVAHAGGEFAQTKITDSLDALNANSPYFDLFEIDLAWTADRRLVCLHDWQDSFRYRFGFLPKEPLTLEAFRKLVAETVPERPENCTLDTLAQWLRNNPGKRVVTDIKEGNLEGLALIAQSHPDLRARVVPQAYQPAEIGAIRELGFPDVIWTLYSFGGGEAEVLSALKGQTLFALTMPEDRAATGLAQRVRAATGLRSYVHTVNDPDVARCHAAQGIAGIYTDTLRGPMPAGAPVPANCPKPVEDDDA